LVRDNEMLGNLPGMVERLLGGGLQWAFPLT